MGKLFLLGDDCVDHVVQCRMDEMHLGILLGLLVLVLAGLVMRCIFSHGTGTIDGTIHDDTDFLPGLEVGSVSKWGDIDLDNPAVEWGQGFGAGRRSLIGGEVDGSLHIDCFFACCIRVVTFGLSIFYYNKNNSFNFLVCIK
jgi:hypothetical protein